jgi:hypothetical protein
MKNDMNKELVRAKIRRWRDLRSGWLVIEPDQMVVYRNKLIGGPQKVKHFETSRLVGVETDMASNNVKILFHSAEEEPGDELFDFQGKAQTEAVNTTLTDMLKDFADQKKRQEEEADRVEKERLEDLKRTRERFSNEIWETSETLWLICKADYSMVRAVIDANWSEARQQYSKIWQQADRLKNISQLELTAALKELDEAFASQNGEEIIQKASCLIKQMSVQILQSEMNWARWQNQKQMLVTVMPNCNHLPYFLLFSAGYFEALLAAQIDDWASVNNVFPLLQSCSLILQRCFGLVLDGFLEETNSATAERNLDSLMKTAQQLECAVLSIFKARPFKFELSTDQSVGKKDVNLPE